MPAYPRKHQLQGNLTYHVFNRGNRKSHIFHDIQDYRYFMNLLAAYARKKELSLYHWVIMPNHYHLLLEIPEPEKLSSAMAGINLSYSRYYHKKYNTAGFLWQGRFKSQPIQKDLYLLVCGRYIECNPVKAKLVDRAEKYAFSSAKYYANGSQDNLTANNPSIINFGLTTKEQRLNYKKFLWDFDPKDIDLFNNTAPAGDKFFSKKLINKGNYYLPRRQGRGKKIFFT